MDSLVEKFKATSIGEKTILIAGALLFIVGFFPWYSVDLGPLGDFTRSGWQSPGAIWSILAILAGAAMAGVVALKNFGGTTKLPENVNGVTWPKIMLGSGVAAVVLILIKLLNESSHLGFGFFLGIILAIALAAGGFLMYRDEKATTGREA